MGIQIAKSEVKEIVIKDTKFLYKAKTGSDLIRLIITNAKNGDLDGVLKFTKLETKDNINFLITCAEEYIVGWEGVSFEETGEPAPFDKSYIVNLPFNVLSEFALRVVIPEMKKALSDKSKEKDEVKN